MVKVKPKSAFLLNPGEVFAGKAQRDGYTPDEKERWQALRSLRNDRSHLRDFILTDPGQAAGFPRTTAERINALFPVANQPAPAPTT